MDSIQKFVYSQIDRCDRQGVRMGSKDAVKVPPNTVAYAVSIVLAGSYAPVVVAQTKVVGLEEITVTARKREESLLDIPQEIQAIGQREIERANLNSLDDFSRFVPSLSYNSTAPGRGAIYFRGVADDSSSFIADSSAAIYLDEQPLTQSAQTPEIRLVDIERIEALPGPQGTLYGSSSQSGTLRYITNKPDPNAFASTVSVDGNSVQDGDQGYDISGVLNLPLSQNLAIRLVGFTARDAGFIDNVLGQSLGGTFDNAGAVAEDINNVDYSGGRAAMRWLVNDAWTVDTGLVYQKMKAHTYSEDNVLRSGHELEVVRFLDETRDDEWGQLSVTLQGDLGWAKFTSATSYFTRSIAYHQDNTDYAFFLSQNSGANYANYDLGPDPRGLGWDDTDSAQRVAQELRLQGATSKTTWLAGLFYERIHTGYNFLTRIEDYESTPSFNYWATYYDVQPGRSDNAFYRSNNDQITEQYAAFGEFGYSPSDRWTFTAGLRWFEHTRHRDYFIQQPNHHFTANLGAAENTTSDFTKKLSVQYRISNSAMVYALFSDGFRAGGRNVARPGTVLPADYDADFLDNYEVGFKSRWLDDRLSFNITAFKMEWKNYQVEVVDPGPLYAVLVANVGDAEIEGLSADFSARLWDSLDFGLNVQFIDPKTTADNPIIGTAKGTRLPFSPKDKGAVWLEYTYPRQFAGGKFYGRFQWTYNGNSLNGVFSPKVQPAYQISDVKLGFEADDWEIYAYVDNLFDERAILFNQDSAPPGTITINTPRMWGIGFTKSWGGK
jgi:outer membrane receptor protein involved in Fe transport